MELKSIQEILEIVSKRAKKKRVAVAASQDIHVLEAVMKAYESRLIEPVLFGDTDETKRILDHIGASLPDEAFYSCTDQMQAATAAVRHVREGGAEILMKGRLETGEIMRAVIDKETGLLGDGVISLISIFEIAKYHKLIAFTDSGINREPSLAQKKEIVKNAVGMLRAFGYDMPKVAALCAVETVNPKMPETLDAAALAEMSKRGEIENCIVEGPISMDIAMNAQTAKYKGYESRIAGETDIMLWPNVLAGNLVIKAIGMFADVRDSISLAVGAKVPLVITSRGAPVDSKVKAIIAASAMCQE